MATPYKSEVNKTLQALNYLDEKYFLHLSHQSRQQSSPLQLGPNLVQIHHL